MDVDAALLLAKEGQEPIDMECGSLVPIYETDLAMIAAYRYASHRPARVERKIFPAYVVNATLGGAWHFHRGRRRYVVEAGQVTAGSPGNEYGCSHSPHNPNYNLLVALVPEAIDEEIEPLFKRETMAMEDIVKYVLRATRCSDSDEFESMVFRIVDLVSDASHDGQRRNVTSLLRVQRLKRYIEYHFAERLTLEELAKTVGVNRYTCVRQFTALQGETPFAYLTRCRVEKAKRLLSKRTLAIEDVADRCGFGTHSYFCRAFKRVTGLSPSAYRKVRLA